MQLDFDNLQQARFIIMCLSIILTHKYSAFPPSSYPQWYESQRHTKSADEKHPQFLRFSDFDIWNTRICNYLLPIIFRFYLIDFQLSTDPPSTFCVPHIKIT